MCVALAVTSGTAWACKLAAIDARWGMEGRAFQFPSASDALREGFVRVVNHSAWTGEVQIHAVDDSGRRFDAVTLDVDANETVHFNSGDLETGNPDKGLPVGTGAGEGDWHLGFSSNLDIEVLAYIRTSDGFLTGMNSIVPIGEAGCRVAIFNPGSNVNQVSILRLVNLGPEEAAVTINARDDAGFSGLEEIGFTIDAGAAREFTARELESGGSGFEGMLGDGTGKWRLVVWTEQPVVAMNLLESPEGHLTNLSSVPIRPSDGVHRVPFFPAAGDASGRQGFVRIINRSPDAGEIRIRAYDESDRDYESLTLRIGANEVAHFNSDHLEHGGRDLPTGIGAGQGDWRLELTSDLDMEVLAYMRTRAGFLTSMHDVAPVTGNRHHVAVFNPGSNTDQVSRLRLVNPGEVEAAVAIRGIDDRGESPGGAVDLVIPPGDVREFTTAELESGDGLDAALGDGTGKWRLVVESVAPLLTMSLLESPTGHITNLSATVPRWDPVRIFDVFAETTLGNVEGVETSVVDAVGFEPGEHGQRITDVLLANTDHAKVVQIGGHGAYRHQGQGMTGENTAGYVKHAQRSATGIFWTATDINGWYVPGRGGWLIVDGRPFTKEARTFARWARQKNVLFVSSLENSTLRRNDEGGYDPIYCDDYDLSAGDWAPLCGVVDDYVAHSGTGIEKVIFVGGIDSHNYAGAAIRADGVFAPHAIYVESPDGSTSQATPVLAAYAANLWFANPKWGAARLKRELMDLAREETVDYDAGSSPEGTLQTEERTVKVIRPDFAPSAVP